MKSAEQEGTLPGNHLEAGKADSDLVGDRLACHPGGHSPCYLLA